MKNMTEGAPLKLIFPFMVPLLIGNLFQQLYNISDIIIVGQMLGMNALAAVGATAPIFILTIFVTFGLASGFSVITGQRFGADDMEGVRRSFATSIILSVVITTIMIVFFNFIIDPLLKMMNVPPDIYENGRSYIMIVINGLYAMMAYNLLSAILRALGDSKTPLYALIISTLLNIGLAITFVGPLQLGIPGCARALVIAQSISALFCVSWIWRYLPELHLSSKDFVFAREEIVAHIRTGLPMAGHFSVLGVGILVMQSVTNGFGPETIAGFTAAIRIEQICTQPMVSAGLAMAVFAAQNYGARKFFRIREGVKKMSLCSLAYAIVATVLIITFGENIVMIFLDNPTPEVMASAHTYFHYSIPFYFFLGQIFIYRNTLQGMGFSMVPICGAVLELFARCGSAIFLAPIVGFVGVCLAEPISWFSSSSLFAACYFYFIRILDKKQ
ncbi:MAG: MATE family efflux transporter [Phascolarctobacterium sp.]|nr:MATE family efflux transporter [Phascolarctobacterium sp.]